MNRERRTLLTDITGVLGSNIVSMAAVLGLSVLLSRSLGPEGYGLYTSLFAVPLIVMGLVQLGLSRSAIFHLGNRLFPEGKTIGSIYILLIFTSLVGILFSLAGYALVGNPHFKWVWMLLILLGIPFMLGNIYTGGIFIGRERIRVANRLQWMPVTLNLILATLLVGVMGWGITGALISMLVATALIFFIGFVRVRKLFDFDAGFYPEILRSLAGKGFVYALNFLLLQINYKVDVVLLQRMVHPKQIGYYSLGVSITEQLWLLPYAIGIVLMSRTANSKDKQQMNETTALMLRTSVPASILGALMLVLLTPIFLPLIFGEKFAPSVAVVQTILPGVVIFMVYRIIESYYAGLGPPLLSIRILLVSALLNILLNIWWIPRFGILGAAWATNVSYSAATLVFLGFFRKESGINWATLLLPRRSDWQRLTNKGNF
ncbi:MAG: polysaccharide biosynthesis C-terminal domain-containing protein [Bacteroidales bacterium]